jgi:hypothetical protein
MNDEHALHKMQACGFACNGEPDRPRRTCGTKLPALHALAGSAGSTRA